MGLRLSEGFELTVLDIDGRMMQVHIREGKGGKDRLLPLPKCTLLALRYYWSTHRHPKLIFPGIGTDLPMERGGIQKTLKQVVCGCGIHKHISPNSLRHCFVVL